METFYFDEVIVTVFLINDTFLFIRENLGLSKANELLSTFILYFLYFSKELLIIRIQFHWFLVSQFRNLNKSQLVLWIIVHHSVIHQSTIYIDFTINSRSVHIPFLLSIHIRLSKRSNRLIYQYSLVHFTEFVFITVLVNVIILLEIPRLYLISLIVLYDLLDLNIYVFK